MEKHYATIIISKDAWKFLMNAKREQTLTEEQLNKIWSRQSDFRNQGANSRLYPIEEDEIRIYEGSFKNSLELNKLLLEQAGFKYRSDDFILDCFEF